MDAAAGKDGLAEDKTCHHRSQLNRRLARISLFKSLHHPSKDALDRRTTAARWDSHVESARWKATCPLPSFQISNFQTKKLIGPWFLWSTVVPLSTFRNFEEYLDLTVLFSPSLPLLPFENRKDRGANLGRYRKDRCLQGASSLWPRLVLRSCWWVTSLGKCEEIEGWGRWIGMNVCHPALDEWSYWIQRMKTSSLDLVV